jgi:hypothetical protein
MSMTHDHDSVGSTSMTEVSIYISLRRGLKNGCPIGRRAIQQDDFKVSNTTTVRLRACCMNS